MEDVLFVALLASALGSALMAGLFFAFSTAVMTALASRPSAEGMEAMKAINTTILNPLFLSAFMGTAAGCMLVSIMAVLRWEEPGSVFSFAGGLVYILGAFGVTITRNVPRNNALEQAQPTSPDGTRVWADYLSSWTAWNHVRTVAALLAALLLLVGLCS